MDKISIVVPCYNEEDNIEVFIKELKTTISKIPNVDYEIIFVDDGSIDNTFSLIEKLNKKNKKIKLLSFSRNFGKEAAILAGLRMTSGDCAITIDADLQHPINLIPKMFKEWKNGFEIVNGIKKNRINEKNINKITSKLFNDIISKSTSMDMKDASDYNLIDRKIIDVLTGIDEYNSFYRGMTYWVGFKTTRVYFNVEKRYANKTKWSMYKRLKYSLKNLAQFTYAPLNLVGIIGMIILSIGLIAGIDAIISYFTNKSTPGYTTLILLLIIFTGGIMISIGILGVYIAQIYDEVRNRPKYIIKDKIE